jgi:hypothetical protein
MGCPAVNAPERQPPQLADITCDNLDGSAAQKVIE